MGQQNSNSSGNGDGNEGNTPENLQVYNNNPSSTSISTYLNPNSNSNPNPNGNNQTNQLSHSNLSNQSIQSNSYSNSNSNSHSSHFHPNRSRISSFGSDEWFHDDIEGYGVGVRTSTSDPYINTNVNSNTNMNTNYNAGTELGSASGAGTSTSTGSKLGSNNTNKLIVNTSQLYSNPDKHRLNSNNRIALLLSRFPPAAEGPPDYILESTIETQHLWYLTAGKRPQQPVRVKVLVEQLWAKNYKLSEVSYNSSSNGGGSDGGGTTTGDVDVDINAVKPVLQCGAVEHHSSVHSSTVSKSFNLQTTVRSVSNHHVSAHDCRPDAHSVAVVKSSSLSMTLQVPKYRIVSGCDHVNHPYPNPQSSSSSSLRCSTCCSGSVPSTYTYSCTSSCACYTRDSPHAEYLVVVSLGGDHPVTLGFWKRHSDFKMIADRVRCIYIYAVTSNY